MKNRLISLVLVLALVFSFSPQVQAEENFRRLYGATRYETAFAIADELKETSYGEFNAIIVACGSNFADALAGSYLAAAYRTPILLTSSAKHNAMVKEYIRNNLESGRTVFILGGDKAVSADMERGLEDYHVVRLSGATRYETNLAILREVGIEAGSEILVATGTNFADCLSGSATGKPILLVQNQLTDNQKAYLSQLKNCSFCIIGGTNAVSSRLEGQLKDYGPTDRIGGSTRYETSVKVAQRFFDVPDTAVLAYAMNFPDGLCGGPLAYSMGAPLIITATKNDKMASDYAESVCIDHGYVLGGSGLIGDSSCRSIFAVEHVWSDWTVIQEPSYEMDGEELRTCGKCGLEEYRAIEKFPIPTEGAQLLTAEVDKQLKDDLQSRIDEILNTKTEIVHSDTFIPGKTYTGTAYYISSDGDDNNDGLTPETAWQSLDRISWWSDWPPILKPGDAVFFRRGDIFRQPEFSFTAEVEGVTFSAYGEGEKPIFTASSENGTGAEKWKLVYEDETGKKIWQFYRDMRDVSFITFNNGEALTTRVYEYYDGTNYIACEDTYWWMHEEKATTLLGQLPLEEQMTEDLTIISRPERPPENNYTDCLTGPLYLRCDKGNPGALYSSVEFAEYLPASLGWLCAGELVFDNISFRNSGNSFIKMNRSGNWWDYEGTVIQNCEFAFGGGTVSYYKDLGNGSYRVEVQGDGLYTIVKNTTIRNNYFHDMLSTTATYEWDDAPRHDGPETENVYYHVLDNVMVNTLGIRLDSTSDTLRYLDSVVIKGNQIWNTGRMDNGKFYYSEGSLFLMHHNYGECVIEDNVFYGTEKGYEKKGYECNALLNLFVYHSEDLGYSRTQFRNNTYVQYANRDFAYFGNENFEHWRMDDPSLVGKAEVYLNDTTSKFYIIP